MAKLVSKTYGDALFELALEENHLDEILDDVTAAVQALNENPDLSRLMNHPKIDKEEKVKLIEDIFKGQVSDELVGLMRMIRQDHPHTQLLVMSGYNDFEYVRSALAVEACGIY